jgi:hypothetical protein
MPVLEYYGDLWGVGVGDKLYCNSCFRGVQVNTKDIYAIGTKDPKEVESEKKKVVYICDECGRLSV